MIVVVVVVYHILTKPCHLSSYHLPEGCFNSIDYMSFYYYLWLCIILFFCNHTTIYNNKLLKLLTSVTSVTRQAWQKEIIIHHGLLSHSKLVLQLKLLTTANYYIYYGFSFLPSFFFTNSLLTLFFFFIIISIISITLLISYCSTRVLLPHFCFHHVNCWKF